MQTRGVIRCALRLPTLPRIHLAYFSHNELSQAVGGGGGGGGELLC